jgi:hypothetical protein
MTWIGRNIKWVMLVSGGLTTTMLYAAVAPQAALQSTFGETLSGPVAEVVVRNWGALIAIVGGMLIYGAFHERERPIALVVGGASKAIFIGLLLSQGTRFLAKSGLVIAVDLTMIALFVWYLLSTREMTRG